MKKVYEEPSVKKVEFEFNERIAASSSCTHAVTSITMPHPACAGE